MKGAILARSSENNIEFNALLEPLLLNFNKTRALLITMPWELYQDRPALSYSHGMPSQRK